MVAVKEYTLRAPSGRNFLADIRFSSESPSQKIILFLHGFKGFKDWGHFNQIADEFSSQGFDFIKFNFSHNGTTPEQPLDFADLDAFGNNNYLLELEETHFVLDKIAEGFFDETHKGKEILLLGHSRGGGIAMLAGWENNLVKKVACWAPISSTGDRLKSYDMEAWKKEGVVYIDNARTRQQMPLYYQLYENWLEHRQRLDIELHARLCDRETLIIHGTADEAVDYRDSDFLAGLSEYIHLELLPGSGHTFGGAHPWEKSSLTADTLKAIELTAAHFS